MQDGCETGVKVVETTVGAVGPYRFGVGNVRERDGAPGVKEATVSVWREGSPPDAPLAFRGIVTAGDRIVVEGRAFRITSIVRLPPTSLEPGGSRNYLCIVEE